MNINDLYEYDASDDTSDDTSDYNNMTDIQQQRAMATAGWGATLILDQIDHPSEAVQQLAVQQDSAAIGSIIEKGITPSETVQQLSAKLDGPSAVETLVRWNIPISNEVISIALKQDGMTIAHIPNPSSSMIFAALTSESMLRYYKTQYDHVVRHLFPNSAIMVSKWIRFGDTTRSIKK
jgi:hypothetical protein